VSIAEQDFAYEAKQKGASTRDARTAVPPGATPPGATPGSGGTTRPDRVEQAKAGESAQQLLARVGLDPDAWRGAMTGLDSPLALAGGTPVQLGPEVRGSAGLGAAAGFTAGAAPTSVAGLAAALGVPDGTAPAPPPGHAVAGAEVAAGFALSAAGGIAAAAATVQAAATGQAVAQARAGFAVPGDAGVTAAVGVTGGVDARASTYGRGVPLHARAAVSGSASATVASRARRPDAPPTGGSAPPWERLPPAAPA